MLTNNIFLKSFLRKKSESKVKKKLKLLVKQKNELFKSMSKDYIDSYNLKKIKKITKKNSIKLIGIGGSILGSQAIYNFDDQQLESPGSVNHVKPLFQDNVGRFR